MRNLLRSPLPFVFLWSLSASAAAQITEDREFTPADGTAGARLGGATAVDGGWVVAGAYGDDDNGPSSGSAYLFAAASGAPLTKYVAPDGSAGDELGRAVALHRELVVLGAPRDDDNGANSGSAYVFDRASGTPLRKLLPSDGAPGDEFGCAVAVEGDLVVVGAKFDDDNGPNSGSLYVFDATTGAQLRKILPSDGDMGDWFGESVAMDSGVIATGAHGDEPNGFLSGSAYLFDASSGAELFKLVPLDGSSNDFFGAAIDIDDGTVVVGAWADSIFFDHSGSAYLFDVATGAELMKLVPSDGHDRDHFGYSVSIDADVVAIGADEDDDTAFDAGSAYLYDTSGALITKVLASDGANFDGFGTAIAVAAGFVAVGAPFTDDNGSQSGSVYVVDLAPTTGAVFCAGDGTGAACPCGNFGGAARGCANGAGPEGSSLRARGSTSLAADDLVLTSAGSPAGTFGVFFQGTEPAAQGAGHALGNGLRCVGGVARRLEVIGTDSLGEAESSISIAAAGSALVGQSLYYQWWHRDSVGSPCGADFNFSNGLVVEWTP